jgi:hypothetical protein
MRHGEEKKDRHESPFDAQDHRPSRWIHDRNPSLMQQQGPVSKSVAIAPETTTRNRTAVVRMSTDFCDANGSRLSTGTNTTDRKIDPPIQLTAASIGTRPKKPSSPQPIH